MIFAVIGSMCAIGSIVYLQLAQIALSWEPYGVFAACAAIDFVMLLFLLVMIAVGKFGQSAYAMEDGSDEAAKSDKGSDEGKGGYEDIPLLPEVFDE